MAELYGLKERQLALAKIRNKLKELEPINAFLHAENPSGIYKISFDKYRTTLLCPDSSIIKNLVIEQKKKLVEEIRELAKQNGVVFNEDEEASFN